MQYYQVNMYVKKMEPLRANKKCDFHDFEQQRRIKIPLFILYKLSCHAQLITIAVVSGADLKLRGHGFEPQPAHFIILMKDM